MFRPRLSPKRKRTAVPLATCLIAVSACGPVQVLNDHESDVLGKVKSGQYELVLTSELVSLRRDAELGRSTGRYQLHAVGSRTWRLDTATGALCLLLTTAADARSAEATAAACPR